MSSAIRSPAFSSSAIPALRLPGIKGRHKNRHSILLGLKLLILISLASSSLYLVVGNQPEARALLLSSLLFAVAWATLKLTLRPWLWFRMWIGALIGITLFQTATHYGNDYAFLWLYLVPPAVFFFFGHLEGSAWTLLTYVASIVALMLGPVGLDHHPGVSTRFLLSFVISSVLAFEVEYRRRRYTRRLIQEREASERALKDIETLQGFLPICAYCKSIRDDDGFWRSIDDYLTRHSLAQIASSRCPECRGQQKSGGSAMDPEPTQHRRAQRPESSTEALRRRGYLAICLVTTVLLGFFYGTLDMIAGNLTEGAIELAVAALFSAGLVAVRRAAGLQILFHGYAFSITSLLVFELAVGGADGHAFLWLLLIPPIFYALLGKSSGTWWLAGLFTATVAVYAAPGSFPYSTAIELRSLAIFLAVAIMAFWLESAREAMQHKLTAATVALSAALDHEKTLKGLIPLCSGCKKIRDDDGFWQRVESYLGEQTGATLSHGLCPRCCEQQFGDLISLGRPETS